MNDDEDFDYGSLPIQEQQEFVYELIGFKQDALNPEAREMFWDVMYNDDMSYAERMGLWNDLNTYMWDEYGIDMSDVWDWDDFRSWYDGSG